MVQGCARARTRPDRAAAGAAAELGGGAADLLQSLFSVQGALTDAQAAAVAANTGCSADAARDAFRNLASSAAQVARRAGERAAEAAAGAAANGGRANGGGAHGDGAMAGLAAAAADPARVQAALAAAASERQAALGKLRRLINEPGDGGLRDARGTGKPCLCCMQRAFVRAGSPRACPDQGGLHSMGPFVSLLAEVDSGVARGRAAAAVAASRPNIRAKLVATAGFLTTLEAWLEAAKAARQHTLLQQLLAALRALPLEAGLLRSQGCAPLLRLVRHLHEKGYDHGRVQAAAAELYGQWQQTLQARGGGSSAGDAAAGGREAAAQQQPQQQQQQQPGAGGSANGGMAAAARHALPELVPLGRKSSSSAGLPPRPGSAGEVAAPAVRGYQSLAAAGGLSARSAHVPGIMSADDIKKARERKAAQARLQQLRAKEAGVAVPGTEQAPAAAAAAAATAAPQQQQQQQAVAPKPASEPAEAARKRQRGGEGRDEVLAAGERQAAGRHEPPRSPKRSRPLGADGALPSSQQQEQRRQAPWQPPPGITLPQPKPDQHPVAWGEGSTEVRARAQGRSRQPASTRVEVEQPLVPEPRHTQQPEPMPYVPTDPLEAEEQEEKLRAGGWRPLGAAP